MFNCLLTLIIPYLPCFGVPTAHVNPSQCQLAMHLISKLSSCGANFLLTEGDWTQCFMMSMLTRAQTSSFLELWPLPQPLLYTTIHTYPHHWATIITLQAALWLLQNIGGFMKFHETLQAAPSEKNVCLSTLFTHRHWRQTAFRQRSSLAKQSGDFPSKIMVYWVYWYCIIHIAKCIQMFPQCVSSILPKLKGTWTNSEYSCHDIHPGTINTESTRERLSPTRITSSAFCSFFLRWPFPSLSHSISPFPAPGKHLSWRPKSLPSTVLFEASVSCCPHTKAAQQKNQFKLIWEQNHASHGCQGAKGPRAFPCGTLVEH